MDRIKITIYKKSDQVTVKQYLRNSNVGRGKIEEIRNSKSVFINNQEATLDSILKEGDILEFRFIENIDFKPSNIEADVIYEDEYLLVVNKPSGIIIHPDDKTKEDDTLVNRVARYYYSHKIFRNVRYIHRIDEETSGIVVFAKDFLTHAILNRMIENCGVEKDYVALCENTFSVLEGEINLPIGRDRHVNNKYRVSKGDKNAKRAITYYNVKERINKKISLVKLKILTGRTHQIRVHMSHFNHPLCGDVLYGGKKDIIDRVALHSYRVIFPHPFVNEMVFVTCPWPEDMDRIIRGDLNV